MQLSPWRLARARFGLGARLGEGVRADDAKSALRDEIADPGALRLGEPALKSTPEILADVDAFEQRRARALKSARLASTAIPDPNAGPPVPPPNALGIEKLPRAPTAPQQQAFRAEALARLKRACLAPIGFGERLVAFWSNHFCVSVAKSGIGRASAGAFEREAIRPHVLGKFTDMLLAVERHPAMLNFLDSQQSIGPNSIAGHGRHAGINENLAREILELHTMGVGSGYTQGDVTQLAYMLTGWTIARREARLDTPNGFTFNANAHEPLAATLRGRLYLQDGAAQGEAALVDLAREDATALHLSRKFARHFVADSPDAALVERLAQTFRDSDGDLAAFSRALIDDPVAWETPPTKMRNPWEMLIAMHRAFGQTPLDPSPTLTAISLLGMPLWGPAGPNGFPDEAAAWTSPEGVKIRVEVAMQFAYRLKSAPPPLTVLEEVLGPDVSVETRETVARAETPAQAYALLILSPEFQRR